MKNKKSLRGQKSVFVGDKPSPQKYYPTPKEQIANMVLKDMEKGNLESGIQLLKKDLFKGGNLEKDLEYMKRQVGGGYAIEDFIERGFW
jgi:hypothetical protein